MRSQECSMHLKDGRPMKCYRDSIGSKRLQLLPFAAIPQVRSSKAFTVAKRRKGKFCKRMPMRRKSRVLAAKLKFVDCTAKSVARVSSKAKDHLCNTPNYMKRTWCGSSNVWAMVALSKRWLIPVQLIPATQQCPGICLKCITT